MFRHCHWLVCASLLLGVGCDEAKEKSEPSKAPATRPVESKTAARLQVVAQHPPASMAAAAVAPSGSADSLADVLARYAKLEGAVEGAEPHVFGLTMHRLTIKPVKDTAVMVRVGEEGGTVGAHEVRALFGDEVAANRIREGLAKVVAAALGEAGHHNNAEALARQAMADLDVEACKAGRLGSFQLVAAYKPQGTANQHELSLLLGDTRAKGPGSQKLLGMLAVRARACGGVRAGP